MTLTITAVYTVSLIALTYYLLFQEEQTLDDIKAYKATPDTIMATTFSILTVAQTVMLILLIVKAS